mmetsp:Transcript_26794/g.28842  ORF Transcript_26794/g.28842 Transcript_26794/m.28842 type:complete len:125 (+) Transcript_26794:166-540(+)
MRWLAYKPKSTNYSIRRPSNSTQNNMSMVGPFMLASIFVGVAIIMGDTSHAFASLSSSTSSMNGDRTGIVNSDPWNSKLYNSASSTSSSSSSSWFDGNDDKVDLRQDRILIYILLNSNQQLLVE